MPARSTYPWPTFLDVLTAYQNCCAGKSRSLHQSKFESHLGENISSLTNEIHQRTYKPLNSVCFVVTHPKPREIFAARFRDRIVHHLIVSELSKIWEKKFSHFSFACRKNKGTHGAIRELQKQARRMSQGGRKEVYALQLDVASFFVSIDRAILKNLMLKKATNPQLRWLIVNLFDHDARIKVQKQSPPDLFNLIPDSKSWFHRPAQQGVPIGNLTSQFGANLYLNDLDQQIVRILKPNGYLRYMDDFTLLDTDPEKLKTMIEPIDSWLLTNRKQTLNSRKTTLKSLKDGIEYLGYKIKQTYCPQNPAKLFLMPNKKWDFLQDLREIEMHDIPSPNRLHPLAPTLNYSIAQKRLASINARLGLQKHAQSYRFRAQSLETLLKSITKNSELPPEHSLQWETIKIKKDFTSVKIR
jgi:RNA-directed DNA polymerase